MKTLLYNKSGPEEYASRRKFPKTASSHSHRHQIFWLLGLFNNIIFVILNANANEILPNAVGLVYLCNVLPSLFLKGLAPYVFPYTTYKLRVGLSVVLNLACVLSVALSDSLGVRLTGIAAGSFAGSLGEITYLSLVSVYHVSKRRSIVSAWSSGTGFAGIAGYLWVISLSNLLSARHSILASSIMPICIGGLFFQGLYTTSFETTSRIVRDVVYDAPAEGNDDDDDENEQERLTDLSSRFAFFRSELFVQYVLPLFFVYFAEYALQSGVWASMNLHDDGLEAHRVEFYHASNLVYQVGVFASRSSGSLVDFTTEQLYIFPVGQILLFVFFYLNAVHKTWWNYGLLAPAFVVGLLGGAVYVNAFKNLSAKERNWSVATTSFALSSVGVGDSVGIVCSNVVGVAIQRALTHHTS